MAMHTLQIPAISLRSARSSSSTTSSLDSTFSDISGHASSSSSSSPPNSKTNAFFASPFSTRSPSPSRPPSPLPADKQPPRSLTADFFSTPVRAPSPPASSAAPPSVHTIHASRIFPSRYTSALSERRTPEFSLLEVEADPFHVHRGHARNLSSSSEDSSASASSSFTSSFPRARLPTPPPSPLHRESTIIPAKTPQPSASTSRVRLDDLVDNEPTPRPADREPIPMLRFERSLLLQRQAQASASSETTPPIEDEESDTELDSPEDYEPRAGNIIALPAASQLPLSPLTLTFSLPGDSKPSSTNDFRDRNGEDQDTPTPKNEDGNSISGPFAILSPASSLVSSPTTDVPSPQSALLSLDDNHLHPASISSSTTTSRGLPSPTASVFSNSHDRPSSADLGPHQNHSHHQHQPQNHKATRKPQLRLLRSLGHGAFSAVWLAEDLSQVPLTLVSRRSVRDLRRMASGKEKERSGSGHGMSASGVADGEQRDRERRSKRRERERLVSGVRRGKSRDREGEAAWSELSMSKLGGYSTSSAAAASVLEPIPASPIPAPTPVAASTPLSEAAPVAKSPRPPSKLRGLKNMLSFSRAPNTAVPPSSLPVAAPPTVLTPQMSLPISPISPADTGGNSNLNSATSLTSPVALASPVSSVSSLQASISRTSSADSQASTASSSSRLKWHIPLHPHQHAHLPQHLHLHPHHSHHPHSHIHPHSPLHNDNMELDDTDMMEQGHLMDTTSTLERDASLRKFRARVRGTRPPASLGRAYLDERDGEMGEPRTGASTNTQGGPAAAGSSRSGVSGSEVRTGQVDGGVGEGGHASTDMDVDANRETEVGLGANLSRNTSLRRTSSSSSAYGRLVAVKMTPRRPPRANVNANSYTNQPGKGAKGESRALAERARERQHRKQEEERTRVGFVREVEVLKHISHPNITPLLAHLSSSTHHILVLPYLPGGDLLGLVNNDIAWGKLSETVLRRIWCELCKAVGWMHGVGLVHRDIKLENILLTAPTFSSLTEQSPVPTLESLPAPPLPFIKLTDFGLSRFVEIDANGDAELLSTRCGSEAYAAPELVTGGAGTGRGVYDARKTDAWACGVVLYALVGRQLPFGEGVAARVGIGAGGSKIGGERGLGRGAGPGTPQERRTWLMRIANGEWEWPGASEEGDSQTMSVDGEELVGPKLVRCCGAKRIVTRLLVRNPKKRARIADLWDDTWMNGGSDTPEQPSLPGSDGLGSSVDAITAVNSNHAQVASEDTTQRNVGHVPGNALADDLHLHDELSSIDSTVEFDAQLLDEEEEEDELDTDGCLFDQEGIDSITRREVV